MLKIAITGGIASGKSFFLKVASDLKIPTISADEEIAKIYQDCSILSIISQALGVENPSKENIRPIVLKDKTKLKVLEKILYQELRKRFENFEENCRRKFVKACFFEIPLLFEKGTQKTYDKIINIETPIFIQKERFLTRSKVTEKDFYRFQSLQLHFQKKRFLTTRYNGVTLFNTLSRKAYINNITKLLKQYL